MYETMSNLNFDNKFVEKIYDEKQHTLLDFFFQEKPNVTFNQYLNNISTNEKKFKEFLKTKPNNQNEMSFHKRNQYETLKNLEAQRIED